MATSLVPISSRRPPRLAEVEVGDDDAGAFGGEPGGDGLADAAGRAGDERDAAGVAARAWHPLELGLLEGPVLDAELLRLVDGRVGRHGLGAAHDVDRVDVELAGDPGGLLVLAEGEHPDAGHEHDGRVGTAHRGGVGGGVARVVGRVVLAVCRVQLVEARDDLLDRGDGRQVDDERLDLGAEEVVGARRAERGEVGELVVAKELEHDVGVGEVTDHRAVLRGDRPDVGGQRRRLRMPIGLRQGGIPGTSAPKGSALPCSSR